MKKLGLVVISIVMVVSVLGFTACTGANTDYNVYYVKDGDNVSEVWYSLTADGKWQSSNGEFGKYYEKGETIEFYSTTDEYKFSGVKIGNTLAVSVDGKTEFAVDENAKDDETVISLKTVYDTVTALGYGGTLEQLIEEFKGDSAYAIAVNNGFEGTEKEWLDTLVGKDGLDGKDGRDGLDGKDGVDGKDGKDGENGKDGRDGVSIISIEKTDQKGNVDTYTITLSDGSTYRFQVTNGSNATGSDLPNIDETITNNKNVNHIRLALLSTVSVRTGMFSESGEPVFAKTGTGVIYKLDKETGDAYIITNYHVVYNSSSASLDYDYMDAIKVYLYGSEIIAGTTTPTEDMGIDAQFIGGSKTFDIAVVKVTGSEFLKNSIAIEAEFGDSEDIYIGQDVITCGNSGGYGISVTEGVISLNSEYFTFSSIDGVSGYINRRVIRVDAAINPGNSGGGLYDTSGRVLGITGAKNIETNVENMGYVIPSTCALAVARYVINNYEADNSKTYQFMRPLVGMTIYTHSSIAVINEKSGMPEPIEDIRVLSTSEGSLSEAAGFLEGDKLKTVQLNDGKVYDIINMYSLTELVMIARENDVIHFVVERDGQEITLDVTITAEAFSVA